MSFIIKNTIVSILILIASCSPQENSVSSDLEIIYKAETRGSSFRLHFKGNTITLEDNNNEKLTTLSNSQVKKINELVLKIKLSEMEALKAPSNKRFSDGALSANFSIKKDSKSYMSSDFDHGNPPKKLKNLFLLLQKYSN